MKPFQSARVSMFLLLVALTVTAFTYDVNRIVQLADDDYSDEYYMADGNRDDAFNDPLDDERCPPAQDYYDDSGDSASNSGRSMNRIDYIEMV